MPSFWDELAGGTVGGVIGMTAVYPLDTVKSRMQMFGTSRYTGMTHVLTDMARKEGVLSLYRGLLSPVAGFGVTFAISFSAYGEAKRFLLRRRGAREDEKLSLGETSLAGAMAGFINSPTRQIFERVKGVMQVRNGPGHASPYSWSGACAVDLVRREGVRMGLFRGIEASATRETVQCALYYLVYEVVKNALLPEDETKKRYLPDTAAFMLAGGMSGCATWLPPVYTIDVLKTRMQTAEPGTYTGLWDCVTKSWRSEGAQILYRGLGPSLLRAFPLHALVFLGYESTIKFLAHSRVGTNMASTG